MKGFQESTLYELLEVDPRASADEVRAAHARALETYGPGSIALYALVDDAQVDALRARLMEAAEVLLDPTRRAGYDRSIGIAAPATLWEEDEDDVADGPHAAVVAALADDPAGEAEGSEPADEPDDAAPEQRSLGLELAPPQRSRPSDAEAPVPPPAAAPAPLLANDWADAVADAPPVERTEPVEPRPLPARPALGLRVKPEPEPSRPGPGPGPGATASLGPAAGAMTPAGGLPPAPPPAQVSPAAPAIHALAAAAPTAEPVAPLAEAPPEPTPASELPNRARDGRGRLDLPPDAEFNGELLRRVREAQGLSLQQVAERTRITRIHLENVEADRYDHLPATVYLRGILVNLARELRLDPSRVSKTYLLAAQRGQARG